MGREGLAPPFFIFLFTNNSSALHCEGPGHWLTEPCTDYVKQKTDIDDISDLRFDASPIFLAGRLFQP